MSKGTWPIWEESRRRREKAIELRRQGLSYKQIRAIVGGSSSSLSLWLRDVALTDLQKAGLRRRKQESIERTARKLHEKRLAREARIREEAASEVGFMNERELFIAGVVAYAAEGEKNKPWAASRRVSFVNSDPQMISLFLRWLELIGVDANRITYRLTIHSEADIQHSLEFWSRLVGVPPNDFLPTTLKRHNPRTSRRNVGSHYRGCLVVSVRRSTDLNRRVDAWFQTLVTRLPSTRTLTGYLIRD